MRNVVVWAIRDARGLNQDEKALLWAIESCGIAIKKWQTLAADAGDMTKDRFYRARKSLVTKSLIRVVRKYNDVSEYVVLAEALAGFVPDSHGANEEANDSHNENGHSHSANRDSHMTETKKNTKKNRKKNITSKKNMTAPVVADATTDTASPQGEDRDEALPSMGSVWVSETGDVLFEADTGSGVYMLSECGVSALSLPNTRTAQTNGHEERSAADWREIRAARPFTTDEKSFLEARSRAFQEERRAAEYAASQLEAW